MPTIQRLSTSTGTRYMYRVIIIGGGNFTGPDPDGFKGAFRILLPSSKKSKKKPDSNCFVTSLGLFIFEKWSKCTHILKVKSNIARGGGGGEVNGTPYQKTPLKLMGQ